MVQDGGTIEDEPAVAKAIVPAKKQFVPYVSKTDTIQVSNVTCKGEGLVKFWVFFMNLYLHLKKSWQIFL